MKEPKNEEKEELKEEKAKDRRIYPYLIAKTRMQGYYEMLLDDWYKIKYFNKKTDKEIYDFFLPAMRDYMFWTFNLINRKEFEEMSNDLMAVVCTNYDCSIFEKNKDIVVCFNSGVCFAITKSSEKAKALKEYRQYREMKLINLRDDESYSVHEISKENKESYVYLYILELYKMIYMKMIAKEIQNPNVFDNVRQAFVKFTGSVYNVEITDDKEGNALAEKIEKTLELDRIYVKIDDEFDLMYKNNKLNDKKFYKILTIILLITLILTSILNIF